MNKNKNNLAHGFNRGSKEKNENKNLHEEVETLKTQMASMHGWARIKRNLITLAIVIGIPMALYAITKTYSFTAGTVAKASEINKNFDDLYARFNAMEGKSLRLIYENTLTAAATSIDITGLDGDVDKEYFFVGRIIGGNGGCSIALQINNDTGTNYGWQRNTGANTNFDAARATGLTEILLTTVNATAQLGSYNSFMIAKSGYPRIIESTTSQGITGTTVTVVGHYNGVWNNTGSNITSMKIKGTTANCLGIGSHIEIWARR